MSLNKDRQSAATDAGYFGACSESGNARRNHYFTHAFPLYAGARMRLLAIAFDLMLVGLLMVASLALVMEDAWLVGLRPLLSLDVFLLIMCIPMLYFVGSWCVFSASPGKMLLSMRVVDAETRGELSSVQCLLRYVGYLINLLSFGLGAIGIFDKRKPLGWHDRLSGTMVIQQ